VSAKLPVVLALCLLGQSAAVSAAPGPLDNARAMEARKECLAGRYQNGIDILAELYARTKDANYIYNQGRCFQQNNRLDEAISRFQEYLRQAPDLAPSELADVRGKIIECEQLRAQQRRPEASPEPRPAPAPPPVPVPAPSPPPAPAQPAAEGRGLRVAGIAGMAVGLVGIGGGIALGLHARKLEGDVESRFRNDGTYSRAMAASGSRTVTLERVSYAVGAAALAGGALCYYLGARAGSETTAVAVWPTLARGGAGGALAISF
jgi:tetratricopeptide (TPR) repeat protein